MRRIQDQVFAKTKLLALSLESSNADDDEAHDSAHDSRRVRFAFRKVGVTLSSADLRSFGLVIGAPGVPPEAGLIRGRRAVALLEAACEAVIEEERPELSLSMQRSRTGDDLLGDPDERSDVANAQAESFFLVAKMLLLQRSNLSLQQRGRGVIEDVFRGVERARLEAIGEKVPAANPGKVRGISCVCMSVCVCVDV